jgi:hypothetical protein
VSRWLPKRVRVRLTPFEVSLADAKGIERYRLEDNEDVVEWCHVFAEFTNKLNLPRFAGKLSLDVELSNHFVRYLVIPHRRELRGRAEVDAFVRHRFVQTYGPMAREWMICLSRETKARVAAAVDAKLVTELQALCAARKAKLRSVVPALSAGFDQARIGSEQDRYWYVQRERGRVCIGCVELGTWAQVHSQGVVSGDAKELGAVFQQLAMTSAGWIPNLPIYTQGIDPVTLAALTGQGWRVHESTPLSKPRSSVKPLGRSVESRP